METELTFDGDDACCHHHLDNVAVPCYLPARSAVGAGDMRCRIVAIRWCMQCWLWTVDDGHGHWWL